MLPGRDRTLGAVRFIMHNYYSWKDTHLTRSNKNAKKWIESIRLMLQIGPALE